MLRCSSGWFCNSLCLVRATTKIQGGGRSAVLCPGWKFPTSLCNILSAVNKDKWLSFLECTQLLQALQSFLVFQPLLILASDLPTFREKVGNQPYFSERHGCSASHNCTSQVLGLQNFGLTLDFAVNDYLRLYQLNEAQAFHSALGQLLAEVLKLYLPLPLNKTV